VKALPVLQDGAGVSVLPQLTQKVKRKPYQALAKLQQAKFCLQMNKESKNYADIRCTKILFYFRSASETRNLINKIYNI
jgi:hypothetical protein